MTVKKIVKSLDFNKDRSIQDFEQGLRNPGVKIGMTRKSQLTRYLY